MSETINHSRLSRMTLIAGILLILSTTSPAASARKGHDLSTSVAVSRAHLWQNPSDISSRDLFYGPGGKKHAPHTTYTFLQEDLSGTNPKFDVRDENGTKWRVKLGDEARPEVVASRLIWAIGYYANEDYFLQELHVEQMPHLKRGQNLVGPDGTMHDVRLKRFPKDEKKIGDWKWSDNPFSSQRELNGLRVMMALVNNWDVKDLNNSVYEENYKDSAAADLHYVVSDLGASFGTAGRSVGRGVSKGDLNSYQHSKFISKVTSEYVDFNVPGRPSLIYLFTPGEYFSRERLRWIGKHIPRSDARWAGSLLAQLSHEQIRSAFRAAGYRPDQVEGFASVVESRIAELNKL
jgi:hypothetical protein